MRAPQAGQREARVKHRRRGSSEAVWGGAPLTNRGVDAAGAHAGGVHSSRARTASFRSYGSESLSASKRRTWRRKRPASPTRRARLTQSTPSWTPSLQCRSTRTRAALPSERSASVSSAPEMCRVRLWSLLIAFMLRLCEERLTCAFASGVYAAICRPRSARPTFRRLTHNQGPSAQDHAPG